MVVNGPDITPDPAGVYVGNNAVSSDVGYREDYVMRNDGYGSWEALPNPGFLAGSLWFVSDDKVTRIDSVTGAFQSEIPLPPGYVGIDIMPSGSKIDRGVIWCYCRRIFIDDVCRIVINPADNSFNEIASVTIGAEFHSERALGGGDRQYLPTSSFIENILHYSESGPYLDSPTWWLSPACDSERRLVWSVASVRDMVYGYYDGPKSASGIEAMLVRTNVTKPLNDEWGLGYGQVLTPPAWNSQKQKQAFSIFPLGGTPTGIVALDDGSVFISQIWGYRPWDPPTDGGIVVKYSPWIDQEVTETHQGFNEGVTYEGPVEEARVELSYQPGELITDGSNVWGSSYPYEDGDSVYRISGTSGALTHEVLFPGENVIDMTEGGVYLYVLLAYSGYPAQPEDNRLVKLYKSNLSIVDEMNFPHAYRFISYDSETLWVKTSISDGSVDRMHKIRKSLFGTPWWLAPSYPLGYTDSDGIERGALNSRGRLSKGVPGSWGGHLIFVDIGERSYVAPHTLMFDPTTGYADILPLPGTGYTIMPEYARGNQGGGAGFYSPGSKYGYEAGQPDAYIFDRYRFPEPLPPNSKIAIHDSQEYSSDGDSSVFTSFELECSVLYESINRIAAYYSTNYYYPGGYLDLRSNYGRVGIKRYQGQKYNSVGSGWTSIEQCEDFPMPSGVTEMRSMGSDLILYHDHQWVPNRQYGPGVAFGDLPPLTPQYGNITVVPMIGPGGQSLRPSLYRGLKDNSGPWLTVDADIVCRDHDSFRYGQANDPLGMIFFDSSTQNIYSKFELLDGPGGFWGGWWRDGDLYIDRLFYPEDESYLPLSQRRTGGGDFNLQDLSYTLETNNPVLMKLASAPYRDGNSAYARDLFDGSNINRSDGFLNNAPLRAAARYRKTMLYMLSEDYGMKAYNYGYIRGGISGRPTLSMGEMQDVRVSNDYSRSQLGPQAGGVGIRPKELIENSDGFFVLDSNNVVKRINVTPSPPQLLVYMLEKTRANVFGNDDVANVRFSPVISNEKLSIITWEFGDQTWGLDSGNGLYSNVGVGSMDEFLAVFEGLSGGVTTWPPVGEVNHIYAPGIYQVKVTGYYGRESSYDAPSYLGSRPYSFAAPPYNGNPNGSYLTGKIDATGYGDRVTNEFTLYIPSTVSPIIGVIPITTYGESYMNNGSLYIAMLPYPDAGPDVQRGYMLLRFEHVASYFDPFSDYSNYGDGYLEINFQFPGGGEQPFWSESWASFSDYRYVEKAFVSNWAYDQQFIGNTFDLVARWRSSSNSSIFSPPVRLPVTVGSDPGIAHWSLDHIEIGPNLR